MKSAALIVGGFGGIGAATCADLAQRQPELIQYRTSRAPPAEDRCLALDLTDPASITRALTELARQLEEDGTQLRQVLICSGILAPPAHGPERRIAELEPEVFQQLLQINTLGPLLVARAALPLLPRREPTRLVALSARVGSIGDNGMGGWYSYRISKAALNMGWRSLAHELRRSHPACTPTLYHPGTVATDLSAPFQANVASEKLFSAEQAAGYLLDVLDQRGDSRELAFVDWAGQAIPW